MKEFPWNKISITYWDKNGTSSVRQKLHDSPLSYSDMRELTLQMLDEIESLSKELEELKKRIGG